VKPLRIAIFSDSLLPILNGVSISIDLLVQELRNRGHSVHIFAPTFFGLRENDPNTHRFRAIETPWSKGYPIAYPPFWRMLRTFRKYEFDIIHTHTPWLVGFVGMRWAESHEIPLVTTYHTLYDRYAHYMSMFPRRYIRFRIAKHTHFYYNSAEHVITPSETSARWLQRHGVTQPIHIIPTGSPKKQMFDRMESRAKLGILPEQQVLLYVGRLAKEKNLFSLLETFRLVRPEQPNTRLWLVGDGPFKEELLRETARLGIGDSVKFVGFIPRDEVGIYYAAADLFTFPSITETQGLVVQEATQYGLPAVAIHGGGASESIIDGFNGRIVKNDSAVMATAILKCLRDEDELLRLQQGAIKTSREGSVEIMVDRILEVYYEALGQKSKDLSKVQRASLS
jgi:glycosyltransferase involved in cell wall biosynthesis